MLVGLSVEGLSEKFNFTRVPEQHFILNNNSSESSGSCDSGDSSDSNESCVKRRKNIVMENNLKKIR